MWPPSPKIAVPAALALFMGAGFIFWTGKTVDPESPGYFAPEQSLADPYGLGRWLQGGPPGNNRGQQVMGKPVQWRLKINSLSPEGRWICEGGDKQRIEVISSASSTPTPGSVVLVEGNLTLIRDNLSEYEITATSWKAVSP